jgi:hypothetical protein
VDYWRYRVPDCEEFNQALIRDIDQIPDTPSDPARVKPSDINYKQPVSKYDGYNHDLSSNANFPEFQCNYRTYIGNNRAENDYDREHQSPDDYVYYKPPSIVYTADQRYKITFWTQVADLLHQHARLIAVPNQSQVNYKIHVQSMWYHQMLRGDYDNWHNHGGCQWTGIYYVDVKAHEATEFLLPTGEHFVPAVRNGDLIISPSTSLHRSLPKYDACYTKTIVAINFDIRSKYTTEIFDRLSETHPNHYKINDRETMPFKSGKLPPPTEQCTHN